MMQKFFLLSLVVILSFSCKSDKKDESTVNTETTVYYLIRHAEKDRTTPSKDPVLNEKGLERANNWAKIFEEVKFDLIYSTDYKRTQQTALPTASEKNLVIQNYDPDHLYNQIFKRKTKGKTVLVVGHSNTTPVFVNTILGEKKYEQIDDKDNGKLFIVTVVNNKASVVVENHN